MGDSETGPRTSDAAPVDRVVAVVLAAGAGSRFAGPEHKLLAALPATSTRPAESVVARSLAHCLDAAVGPTVVVTGAVDLDHVIDAAIAERSSTHDGPALTTVANPDWETGQMSSVRCAIAAAAELGAARVVIGLGDQPGVAPSAWRSIAHPGPDAPIAVATYRSRRGNPVSLSSDVWSLLPHDGDHGARALMQIRPDLVREVPCDGSAEDIDTVEDLQQWQSS
ncbi:MAG: NTP transferase domain-containing protein [Actinomycetota bacterium]